MLGSTKIIVTDHAIDMYKERVNELAGKRNVERHVRLSRPVNKIELKTIRKSCPNHRHKMHSGSEFIYWMTPDGVVFVTKVLSPGTYRCITCWRYRSTQRELEDTLAMSIKEILKERIKCIEGSIDGSCQEGAEKSRIRVKECKAILDLVSARDKRMPAIGVIDHEIAENGNSPEYVRGLEFAARAIRNAIKITESPTHETQ